MPVTAACRQRQGGLQGNQAEIEKRAIMAKLKAKQLRQEMLAAEELRREQEQADLLVLVNNWQTIC
jgi:hypothetical protein